MKTLSQFIKKVFAKRKKSEKWITTLKQIFIYCSEQKDLKWFLLTDSPIVRKAVPYLKQLNRKRICILNPLTGEVEQLNPIRKIFPPERWECIGPFDLIISEVDDIYLNKKVDKSIIPSGERPWPLIHYMTSWGLVDHETFNIAIERKANWQKRSENQKSKIHADLIIGLNGEIIKEIPFRNFFGEPIQFSAKID